MSFTPVFFDFLQHIAIGAGVVFALILAIQVGMPKRTAAVVTRRVID